MADDFAKNYSRALRYSASEEGAAHLLSPGSLTDADRYGGPDADRTKRGVIADYLQDLDRDHEAGLLRSGRHVVVHEGRVKPGRWTLRHLRSALDRVDAELFGVHAMTPLPHRQDSSSYPSVDFFTTGGDRYANYLDENGEIAAASNDDHIHPEHVGDIAHEGGFPVTTLVDDTCYQSEVPLNRAGSHWADEYLENHLAHLREHQPGFTEAEAERIRRHPLVEAVRRAPIDEPDPTAEAPK